MNATSDVSLVCTNPEVCQVGQDAGNMYVMRTAGPVFLPDAKTQGHHEVLQ